MKRKRESSSIPKSDKRVKQEDNDDNPSWLSAPETAPSASAANVAVKHEKFSAFRADSPTSQREPAKQTIKLKGSNIVLVPSDASPRKKRRLIVEVVVPTWEEIMRRKQNKAALKKCSKASVKKKKGADISLVDDHIVDSRLALIGGSAPFNINLPKGITDQTVTREFMARNYGGSMQATCPTIGKKNQRKHEFRNFTYLHPDYHPHAPLLPGHPGLFFCDSGGNDWPGLQRVFVRDLKLTIWTYLGQYLIKSCPDLTKEEWRSLGDQTRAHWANEICRQGWGGNTRVRIQARKEVPLGEHITNELFACVEASGRWKNIEPWEVMEAYDRGEERIGVWTLKCVGYDEAFQRELCEKFPAWAASH